MQQAIGVKENEKSIYEYSYYFCEILCRQKMTKPAKIINKKPGNNSLNGASLKNNHPKANEKIIPKY